MNMHICTHIHVLWQYVHITHKRQSNSSSAVMLYLYEPRVQLPSRRHAVHITNVPVRSQSTLPTSANPTLPSVCVTWEIIDQSKGFQVFVLLLSIEFSEWKLDSHRLAMKMRKDMIRNWLTNENVIRKGIVKLVVEGLFYSSTRSLWMVAKSSLANKSEVFSSTNLSKIKYGTYDCFN